MTVSGGSTDIVTTSATTHGRVTYKFQNITDSNFATVTRPKTGTTYAATTADTPVIDRVLPEIELETIFGTKFALGDQSRDYIEVLSKCISRGYELPNIDYLVSFFTQYKRNGLASELPYVWSTSMDGYLYKVLDPGKLLISTSPAYAESPLAFICFRNAN